MKLSKLMAKRIEDKLEELFQKEKVDKDFLPQEHYTSCKERAMHWLEMAFEETKEANATDAGFAIAVHREDEHKDDNYQEQTTLLAAGADPEMGTQAWWND